MAESFLRAAIGVSLLAVASVSIALARPDAGTGNALRLAAYSASNCAETNDKFMNVNHQPEIDETTPLTRLGLSSRPVDL